MHHTQKSSDPDSFTRDFYKTFTDQVVVVMFYKLFKTIEEKKATSNSYMKHA